jgi:hypothetical protein
LKNEYPNKNDKDEPEEKKRSEFNKSQRVKIDEKLDLFVKQGNPGAKFKKVFDRMLAKLDLPKHVKDQLGVPQAVVQPAEKAQDAPKVILALNTK